MSRSLLFALAVTLIIGLCFPPMAMAAEDDTGEATVKKKKKTKVWFPGGDFYPRYIADPLRPQNALTLQWLSDTEIPETGAARFGLRLGGSYGIYRWHQEGQPAIGWQLTFEGGFAGQFDLEWSWDNTGWDGFYGLYLSRMLSPRLGFRFGSQHNSSHIGDEYSERTGRKRIHYTREEAVLGVAWNAQPRTTLYSELGWGNGLRGSMTFRLEAGAQWVSAQKYWKNRASRFAAIDLRTYEETDWSTRMTVQAGYWIPVGDRGSVHRVAFEYGTGRSVMGQFLWERETYFSFGWYYDF
jgi:hypothetical protein